MEGFAFDIEIKMGVNLGQQLFHSFIHSSIHSSFTLYRTNAVLKTLRWVLWEYKNVGNKVPTLKEYTKSATWRTNECLGKSRFLE